MKYGDKVKHNKNKHWGIGRIEGFSKSGTMAEVRWQGPYGGWRNRCKLESLTVVNTD